MANGVADALPQRPDAHVTGEQAVLALRNALPAHWIFRECPPDYGIDCEIEIVAANGEVLGAVVKGQVKGRGVTHTSNGVSVSANSVRYWLALPVPVIIVRVTVEPPSVQWLDVRDYLSLKGRLDSVYSSSQESYSFNFRGAPALPQDSGAMEELALEHRARVAAMRVSRDEDVGGQFIGYVVMVKLFDGDPVKWIQWLRENGSEDQLVGDIPFAFWVKHQAEEDAGFLDRVRNMVREVTQ